MSKQLKVRNGELVNKEDLTSNRFPFLIKLLAHFFSYVFHPLFIPLYVTLFLMYIHPSYFSGIDNQTKFWLPLTVVQLTIFYPVLSVLLLKALGFIDSFFLKTSKDRIIPYIISGIFFFWMFQVCKNYPDSLNPIITSFMLGIFLTSSAGLIANIYVKISLHAMGMGGLLGLFLIIMAFNTMLMTWPLCIAILVTGLVCTSRLIISDHSTKEIYYGLFLGLLCQLVAAVFIL
jgi:hypothetical protein